MNYNCKASKLSDFQTINSSKYCLIYFKLRFVRHTNHKRRAMLRSVVGADFNPEK